MSNHYDYRSSTGEHVRIELQRPHPIQKNIEELEELRRQLDQGYISLEDEKKLDRMRWLHEHTERFWKTLNKEQAKKREEAARRASHPLEGG